jgi:hypothetical protein
MWGIADRPTWPWLRLLDLLDLLSILSIVFIDIRFITVAAIGGPNAKATDKASPARPPPIPGRP